MSRGAGYLVSRAPFALLFMLVTGCAGNWSSIDKQSGTGCSAGWKVTGYFTPVEADYNGGQVRLLLSDGLAVNITDTFAQQVKVEGWGRTLNGWYLGYYNQQWHRDSAPRNSSGGILVVGEVASDPSVLPFDTLIKIPGVSVSGKRALQVNDIGSAIQGRHIDIYTGEGEAARQQTFAITDSNSDICVIKQIG